MGFLDLENEPYHLKTIKQQLARRGLKPCLENAWEIHGISPKNR